MAKNSTNQGYPVVTALAGRLLTAEDEAMISFGKKMENSRNHQTTGELDNTGESFSIGLIIRQNEPKVLETRLDRVDVFLTPTELFYVRSHSPAPKLETASYRLHIDGAVRNRFSLTYQELRDMPAEKRVAILECAGNSRVAV